MAKHIFTCLNCGHITEIEIRKPPEISETEGAGIRIIHIQGTILDSDAFNKPKIDD